MKNVDEHVVRVRKVNLRAGTIGCRAVIEPRGACGTRPTHDCDLLSSNLSPSLASLTIYGDGMFHPAAAGPPLLPGNVTLVT